MEGVFMLIFLSITMLIGSFIFGMLPLALTLSETKMRHITIIGAGLLVGTALAVIIPEGVHSLYSNVNHRHGDEGHNHAKEHNHSQKRSINEGDYGNDDSSKSNLYSSDNDKIEQFLNSISSRNNLNVELLKRFLEFNNNQLDQSHKINERATDMELYELFKNSINYNNKPSIRLLKRKDDDLRFKREVGSNKLDTDKKDELLKKKDDHSAEDNDRDPAGHSAIGVTLVLGFVFMLIIDQIGGKISHRHLPSTISDGQAVRNKVTFTTTLGLVVHAAADGIALGAAAASSNTDVEMIVFIAIMLHKGPAAFGLVSFLIHEGLERYRVRKHLIIFSMAAPLMGIFTFIILKSQGQFINLSPDSTGLCMLFSAGTFLYVSTVHVLPEVQAHNDDRQFKFFEMISFICGAIMPLFLAVGHSH